MPAAYLHESLTLAVLQRLSLPEWWDGAMTDCALIGAQGPDPLFFYPVLPPRLNQRIHQLGSAMHTRRVGEMLRAIFATAQQAEDSVKAWALGYLSHYAVDTAVHPFVYANSFVKGKYLTRLHLSLEKAMDTWLYRSQGQSGIPRHFEGIRRAHQQHKQQIAHAWARAAGQVFPEYRASVRQIRQALDAAVRVGRVLHSPGGTKYRLFRGLGRLLGNDQLITGHMVPRDLPKNDFTNQAQAAWFSPWEAGRERRESLMQLLDQAKARAAALMADGLHYFAGSLTLDGLLARLGAMNFSSGLDWETTRGLGVPIHD